MESLLNEDADDDTSFVFDEDNSNTSDGGSDGHLIGKRAAEPGGGVGGSNVNREIQPFQPVQFSNEDDYSTQKNGRRKNKNKNNKSNNEDQREQGMNYFLIIVLVFQFRDISLEL